MVARGGGEGRGRRQWAEAGARCGREGVCAGGRRRRLSESAHPARGNVRRLQLLARPGPARPPQVSLPPCLGPSLGPQPILRPGEGALPEGSRPQNRTLTVPPDLSNDAPRRPTLIFNSSLAAADLRSPSREPAPHRAGLHLCSPFPAGTPEHPFPCSFTSLGPLEDAPCLGRNPGCAGSWSLTRPTLIPQPQRPCAASSQSPLPDSGVPLPRGLRLYFEGRGGSAEAPSYN